MKRSESRLFK